MDLKQLQYFLAVAEHLNFSRAAESLYISQPALSYQIAELEKELGTELFVRDRRRVYLTTAGSALIGPARETLAASERLLQKAKNGTAEEVTSVLRIGFDDTEDHFELTGITETLARFAEENSGLQLEMMRGRFPELADRVIYGDLDLAFLILRYREHLPPDLMSRQVQSTRIQMVVRDDCPAATCAEAVEQRDLILVEDKPRGNARILRLLENMKLSPRIRQVDSLPVGFTYLQMGKGILLLTELYYSQHHYSGLKAIPIPGEEAEIAHSVVWNRNNTNPAVTQLLERFRTCPGRTGEEQAAAAPEREDGALTAPENVL